MNKHARAILRSKSQAQRAFEVSYARARSGNRWSKLRYLCSCCEGYRSRGRTKKEQIAERDFRDQQGEYI